MTLSDEEARTLIESLCRSRGDRGATEAEMQVVLDWAHDIRVGEALLELVLAGEVAVDVLDGEPYFKSR